MLSRYLKLVWCSFLLSMQLSLTAAQGQTPPLHVYLTWQGEDTSHQIVVNFHTQGKKGGASKVYYDEASKNGDLKQYTFKAEGGFKEITGLVDRHFHEVQLNNLSPGKEYYFIVGDDVNGFSEERKFKTLPLDGPLRIAQGGDIGISESSIKMSRQVASYSPDVIVLGGDLVYAVGTVANIGKWDEWFSMLEKNLITPDGRTIPLIVAVGNHDVSVGEFSPLFSYFFPQGGATYFDRKLGKNTVLFVLDSGHIASYHGAQLTWLQQALKKHSDAKNKIAVYHVPLYPSFRPYILSLPARRAWLGLFDAFHLNVAFEHHDHAFKRTHPLRDGKKVSEAEGTIYLGDGAWGKPPRRVHTRAWYLKKASSTNHFWLVDLNDSSAEYKAISIDGKVIDHFSLNF